MKKILILANHFITIYAFRRELVEKLLDSGYKVIIALPASKDVSYFSNMGCEIFDTPLERRRTNPFSDFKLLLQYVNIIKKVNPDIVLTYTIKPNIYGGIASRFCSVKTIHTVTGLGSVYIRDMWQKNIAALLNKFAFRKAELVFFLNEENRKFYKDKNIIGLSQTTLVVPGSGVNLERFKFHEFNNENRLTFTFIGRVLKDKGIEEFLLAAKTIKEKHENVEFNVVGFVDEEKYIKMLNDFENNGIIHYYGKRNDIPEIIAYSSCIVLPSYGEGRGTVLQEGAAIGRPLITCDTYGCKENVEDGINGFLCKVADVKSLVDQMEKFINLPHENKIEMAKKSREKAEKEFDRNIVIQKYITEIAKII